MKRLARILLLISVASGIALLLGRASLGASPGATDRVSVDSAGSQGNSSSWYPAISADGRFVAFYSYASNLVPGDTNGSSDIFVHDRQTGATERVSVDSAGNQGDADSDRLAISPDGRYVAFESQASNLVPGDTNGYPDIFVHDRQTGATERVSVDSAGNQGNVYSEQPAISADGRYVAFYSNASNLVPGDTIGSSDIFVHDRQTGATERVSVDSGGNQGNDSSQLPSTSADGRYVAFLSWASNLVPGDTNGSSDTFVHDRQTGETTRVSVDSGGNQGNGGSGDSSISADGRYVAFYSNASNLVPGDTNDGPDIFVHDRQTGATERVSVDSGGNQGNDWSETLAISADGRYVAFMSWASNLVPGDTNGYPDIFVHDRQTGATERVSVDSAGNQANDWSEDPAISADGRFVGFDSFTSDLVPGDTNSQSDVFVHDRCPDGVCAVGPTPTPTPTPQPFTYIATGDSIPAAQDLSRSLAYPAVLGDYLSWTLPDSVDVGFTNNACSGTKTNQYENGPDPNQHCPLPTQSQLNYLLSFASPAHKPDLITITVGADDYVLDVLYNQCLRDKLFTGGLSAAATCTDTALRNETARCRTGPRAGVCYSLSAIGDRLKDILSKLTATYPNAIIVVTNYYNPMPLHIDANGCLALVPALPFPFGAMAASYCRSSVVAPLNRAFANTNSLLAGLNSKIASTVAPFTSSSNGRVILADLYSQFGGHCGTGLTLTFSLSLRGKSFSVPLTAGCQLSQSWIQPVYSVSSQSRYGLLTIALTAQGGVHPNESGHQHIADVIWNDIKAKLGSP